MRTFNGMSLHMNFSTWSVSRISKAQPRQRSCSTTRTLWRRSSLFSTTEPANKIPMDTKLRFRRFQCPKTVIPDIRGEARMLQTGTVLNQRYEIVRLIAEGGMGAVYEGRDLKFSGSPVAIKRCLLSGEATHRAFTREAELLANLSHPGVPKVRDLFAEADVRYLVMEYIPGRDLEEILNDRGAAIPTEDALGWMDQALDALSHMHSQRPPVIHRDIKPSNLKLTPSGHVMLIDFGLAKGNGKSSLVGYSANYAPLEQLQGDGTDAQSDLYSLGATMYRLLTGQEPASALERVKQMAKDHRDPLLRVNAINNRAPAAVAQVIWEAMALEREDRLRSADEMRRRLRE